MDGSWWANPLIRLRGRHVAIDLGKEPQPLSSLHRPLSDRGDGDGPGDEDGDGGQPDAKTFWQ